MRVMVGVLTSFDAKKARRCVLSCLQQRDTEYTYEVVVVVNTTDKNYAAQVADVLGDLDVVIVETKSNGKPGLGKQSVVNYMLASERYDALIMVDGDDFFYPVAFSYIEYAHKKEGADVFGVEFTDYLSDRDQEFSHPVEASSPVWLVSWWQTQHRHNAERKPVIESLDDFGAHNRIVWLTLKSLQAGARPYYPIRVPGFEDACTSASCLLGHYDEQYRYVLCGSSNIYVWDTTERVSITHELYQLGEGADKMLDQLISGASWMVRAMEDMSFADLPWLAYPEQMHSRFGKPQKMKFVAEMLKVAR